MRDRGFALLVVLWTVVLLALLATQITSAGRTEARLASNLRAAAAAQAAADGALFEGVFHALDTSAAHWPADGLPHVLRLPSAVVEVRVANEAGRLNPNFAAPELLAALLRAVGADTRRANALAAAIADWRYVDAQRVGGAKLSAYQAAGLAYGPPEAPFRSLDELGLVLGMTPDLLARLAPHLTLYHEGEPDAGVADPEVRQALREAGGPAVPGRNAPDETVVAITASAAGVDGARAQRRAVVRLGQRRDGGLFEMLTWEGN